MRDCYSLDAGLEQKYRNITPCNCGTRQARNTKQFAKHIGKKSLCPSVRLFHQIFISFRHETCFFTPASLSLMKPGFRNDDNAFALTFSYCHIVAHTKLPEPTCELNQMHIITSMWQTAMLKRQVFRRLWVSC